MLNSDETLSFIHRIVQPNIKTILIVIIVFILLLKNLEINVVLIFILILLIFVYHKDIMNTFNEINSSEKRVERIIEDNKRFKKEIHFNEKIQKLLKKLHKYKKYNPNAYEEGYNQLKQFMFIIHDLEKIDIAHPRQYFENAEYHLKQSINHFQSLSISVPEEKLIHGLKYNKYESTKLGSRVGKLCKDLYKHCYHLMFNLSLRLNELWMKDPDIYMNQITMNVGNVEPNEIEDFNWEIY